MHLFKRGTVYWFECVFNGQRYQRSTRVKSQRDAKSIAATFYSALAKNEVGIVEKKRVRCLAEPWTTSSLGLRKSTRRTRTLQRGIVTVVPL
jgi:hypothetical protein